MGPGRRRWRRHRGVPRRTRLGPRRALPPRPRPSGHELRTTRRVRPRRRPVRRRVLRHQPTRGARHGPAAAPAAGDRVGDLRAGRHRPRHAEGDRDRRVRGRGPARLRHPAHRPERRGLPPDRQHAERRVRPGGVHARPRRARRDAGHGVLVLAGGDAPGRAGAAAGRVHARTGRRRDRDVHAEPVHRVLPAARTRAGRPLQAVRRRRGRHRLLRGRRPAAPGTALGRPAQRAPGARGDPRVGGQPGRREQRPDRAERPVAAARHPPGPRERRTLARRGGRRRGPRHRHDARRPDRGRRPPRHVRAGPAGGPAAVARLGQVQHRAPPGRGRRRRGDQDGDGATARDAARLPVHRRADSARRLGRGRGPAAHRAGGVAARRASPPGRSVRVRHLRHQRARDPGAGPRGGVHTVRRGPAGRRGRAVGAVGTQCGGAARPGRRAGRTRGGPAAYGRRLVAGDDPFGVRAPCGGRRRGPGRVARRAVGARRRRDSSRRGGLGRGRRWCGSGAGVSGSGFAVGGDGCGAAGDLGGFRRPYRRVRAGAVAACGLVADRGAARRRDEPRGRDPAGAVGGDGLARRGVGRLRRTARRGRRAQSGRDRGRVRGGCAFA